MTMPLKTLIAHCERSCEVEKIAAVLRVRRAGQGHGRPDPDVVHAVVRIRTGDLQARPRQLHPGPGQERIDVRPGVRIEVAVAVGVPGEDDAVTTGDRRHRRGIRPMNQGFGDVVADHHAGLRPGVDVVHRVLPAPRRCLSRVDGSRHGRSIRTRRPAGRRHPRCRHPPRRSPSPTAGLPKERADRRAYLQCFSFAGTGDSIGQSARPNRLALRAVRYSCATPASHMTSRGFPPATRRRSPHVADQLVVLRRLRWGSGAPPELYQLPSRRLSFVLLRML